MSLLIDVRTALEFSEGYLEGAINIEYQLIAERIAEITTDLSVPILLYCKAGQRSEYAQNVLHALGYMNAKNIGSYEMLKASGFKVNDALH